MADPRTPGQFIKQLLAAREWSQRVLAVILGVDEAIINRLVSDKRPVDAEMALALGDVLGVEAEAFLDLQKSYDLAKARITMQPDPRRTTRAYLFGALPVSEMIKRGWLDAEDVRNVPRVEAALAKFFGVRSADEIEILPHAARKTGVAGPATPAQLAWIYRVRDIAGEMTASRYSPAGARSSVERLSALMRAPEEVRKVPGILSAHGIRFVVVESLASARIDGVCLWLDPMSPVIGLSLRHDRIDNFWFVLRHELEHVIAGHGREAVVLDAELEGERAGVGVAVSDEERVANQAAAEFCIPRQAMDRFIARQAPLFAERDIIEFARTLNIHPGLVAGQLQHQTGRYDRFRHHLVKIRSLIVPDVVHDGWGDVARVGA